MGVRMSTRAVAQRVVMSITRAPLLFSLVIATVVALALVGTGAGSQAAPLASTSSPITVLRALELAPEVPAAAEAEADDRVEEVVTEAEVEAPEEEDVPAGPVRTEVFAQVDGLDLHAPSNALVLAGFHQASTPGSLAMDPVGDRVRVLPSRGRAYPRTSAVDLVLHDEEAVRAPVTGRVVKSEQYRLYNRYGDRRITIRPKGRSDLRVVVLHVEGTHVEVGDRVEGGETVIARTARRFPFRSQVDKETAPEAWPHVHLEVKTVNGR
jgi:biotin carboxyl carrier protein